MRVCLFTPTFLPSLGGAERMADVLARGLTQRGHDVRVLAPLPERGAKPMAELPYRVHRYWRPASQHLWPELLTLPLAWLRLRWKFDVVLAFYAYPTGFAACHARRLLGHKVVVTPRGADLYPHFHALRKPRVPATIAAGYRRADRIVSISGWLTQRIVEVTGTPLEHLPPVNTVPNGIDLAAFDADLATADPGTLGLEQPFLLHMARVHPVKQHAAALNAIAACRKLFESRKMSYAIVGSGEALDAVHQQVQDLELGSIVKVLGRRTGAERAWLLQNATGFVTASREEGMPNAVLEAMAAGLPILASDIGPHRELIENKGWGELFVDGNAESFTNAMLSFLAADHTAMSRQALRLREHYTLKRTLDGYENALLQALGESPNKDS